MFNKAKFLLASTALAALVLQAAPSLADTVVRETVTESPDSTTVSKTVTTGQAGPETTTTTTTTDKSWKTGERAVIVPAGGLRTLNLLDFDLNGDGRLSRNEVGEMLFKLFDTDGNGVIDNIEYEHHLVLAVVPAEKSTVVTYDLDADGATSKTTYTSETFMKNTMLARFSGNKEGISPHEFLGRGFLEADVNRDKAIDLKEWQGAYIPAIDKLNKDKAALNQ